MSYLDPSTWRAATPKEVIDSLKKPRSRKGKQTKVKKPKNVRRHVPGLLVFRRLLTPLDVYAYLHARFGEPNGMQSIMIHKLKMIQEDSGNMINWDYSLFAGAKSMTITGAGREVHVMVEDDLTDEEWELFASALKADFGNYGSEKSRIISELEKWSIFPYRFKAIADRCAELQNDLSEVAEQMRGGLPKRPRGTKKRDSEEWGKSRGQLTDKLVSASVQLSLLTPILFENFIGLITAVLLKPEVRKNRRLAESFRRSPLDVKIFDLSTRCNGFARSVEETNEVMRRYWVVVNGRNDVVHGNVDPVKDSLETVYFKGKMPLFPKGGDAIEEFFQSLLKQYKPELVLQNYDLCHEMIAEILNHMTPQSKHSIVILLNDSQPGWDDKREKYGMLFPDYVGSFFLEGTRYDTDFLDATAG